jgi:two-component system, cell cycle response regulator
MGHEDRKFRILIVDDDPLFLKLLERQLGDTGHEVLTASNGFEAMRVLLERGADIIITDWLMPGMDGVELCRAIREQAESGFVYIIILTVQADAERTVAAFEAGADDFLRKPVDRQELLARLRAGKRVIRLQHDLDQQNREVHLANARLTLAAQELEAVNRKLRCLATTDELTGLINRREALNRLTEFWALADRHHEPLSVALLDIDHFKKFNDTYGHAVGDLVLKGVADAMRGNVRNGEPVCRIGGEEFLILCPRASAQQAWEAAERLRRAVETTPVRCGDLSLNVTASLGVSERTFLMQQPDALLRAADEAMYQAKAAGRNRVCVAQGAVGAAVVMP